MKFWLRAEALLCRKAWAAHCGAMPGGWKIIPVIILMGGFSIYATLRAFEGKFYEAGPYLSPFYSPLIDPHHHWLPLWFSPAMLILAFPLGFRATCYYYRKALYRAFLLDPPACAVGEPANRNYRGETSFPFILQNAHRYFLYGAIVFLCFLWYDAIRAFWFPGPDQKLHFGIGVGTLVLLVNIVLLSLYLLSCHSLRHLIGGKMDCFSCTTFNLKRHTAHGRRPASSMNATCYLPGAVWSQWDLPTSMSAWWPAA